MAILAPVVASLAGFLIKDVVIRFAAFTAVFGFVAFLVPKAVAYLDPFIGLSALTGAFSGLGSGVWFFLDFFNLAFGVPLLISAAVSRFLIRRLPVIG